jgi:hypothetical protein
MTSHNNFRKIFVDIPENNSQEYVLRTSPGRFCWHVLPGKARSSSDSVLDVFSTAL